ncbi:MAG: tetratricopeptide repeat protein [Planctomycetota bacterium]
MTVSEPSETESDSNDSDGKRAKKRRPLRFAALVVFLLVVAGGYFAWWLPRQQVRRAEQSLQRLRYEQAATLLADYPSWGLELGRVHFNQARLSRHRSGYAAALEHLRMARAARFDDAAIDRERALLQIQNGQPATTQADRLDEFCTQAPNDRTEVYSVFASAYLREGKPTDAIEILDRWEQELPDDGRCDYTRAVALQRAGNEDEAMEYYGKAVRKSPQLVDAYLAQARTHATHWRYGQAVAMYRRALQVDPERMSVKIALGKALWKLRRGEEAVAILEPITQSDPAVFPAAQICARYYLQAGDPRRVLAILEPVMESHPDDASLNYMLGSAYHQVGETSRCDAAMKKFFASNKIIDELAEPIDVPESRYFNELIRRGLMNARYDWEQSIKWLNMAARAQPANPIAHELLALRYQENGTPEQALRRANIAYSLRNRRTQ